VLEALPFCPGTLPVVGAACSTLSGAAGQAASAGIDAVFSAAAQWVGSGAVWLIGQVGGVMSSTTSIDLGAGWFRAHEVVMASLAAAVVLPMACAAAIQAVYRQSASMLVRTFLVNLPLSLLGTGVAIALVRVALAVTDAMSAQVLSSAGVDTTNLFSGLTVFFAGTSASAAVPAFVVFVGGLLVALAALVLWLELVVRAAAVSAAVLFLPLALAASVWPAVAHWCRRLADTIVALVLSKLVIAAVLSLAAGALAGGLGLSGHSDGGGFSAVVTGIALLLIATLAPFTLLRLVPAVEAGAIAHLESARHRMQSAARAPVRTGGNLALDLARGGGGSGADDGEAGPVGTGRSGGGAGGGGPGSSTIPMVAGASLGPEAAMAGAALQRTAGSGAPTRTGSGAGGTAPTTNTTATAHATESRDPSGPRDPVARPSADPGRHGPKVPDGSGRGGG
jgi:hypothetical protein